MIRAENHQSGVQVMNQCKTFCLKYDRARRHGVLEHLSPDLCFTPLEI